MRYKPEARRPAPPYVPFPMMAALIAACLLTLSACSNRPIRTVLEASCSPSWLLQPRPAPQLAGPSWRHLADHTLMLEQTLAMSEADKAAALEHCREADHVDP